jgi:hypothetical protein
MIDPKDPETAIIELAKAVDRLNGQVAALMAYITHTSAMLPDKYLSTTQQVAQGLVAPALGAGSGDDSPASQASQGVATIQTTAKQLQPR